MSGRVLRPAAIGVGDQIEKHFADCRLARTHCYVHSFTRLKIHRAEVAGGVERLGLPSRFDELLIYALARVASAYFLLIQPLAKLGASRPHRVRHADVSGESASAN